MSTKSGKSYSELIKLDTFKERLEYLRLTSSIGVDTFGFDRYINQRFYKSMEWRRLRSQIIVRDDGCDLGIHGVPIFGRILVHHMNPITLRDISNVSKYLLNPEYLICVSHDTHNMIHYGTAEAPTKTLKPREPNDTCPWKH